MSFARTLRKVLTYQRPGLDQLSYFHQAFPLDNASAQDAVNYLFTAMHPNVKDEVATPADLPTGVDTPNLGDVVPSDNDYRVVTDDGDGKKAGYRFFAREGESATWHKVVDFDYGQAELLSSFESQVQDFFVYKYGSNDLDTNGDPIAGLYAGTHIYGGANSGDHLTLSGNDGDISTDPLDQTGFVQFFNSIRPTHHNVFDLGELLRMWKDLYIIGELKDGTVTLTVAQGREAYDHSQITSGNPHDVSYDELITKLGTITLGGDTTGLVNLDSSGNKTLNIEIVDDSHNHIWSNIDDADTKVYEKVKSGLKDSSTLTWTFNDINEEYTATTNLNTSNIADLASPAVDRILGGSSDGLNWIQTSGLITLLGEISGSATYTTANGWQITATVDQIDFSKNTDINLENKVITGITFGNPTTLNIIGHKLSNTDTLRIFNSDCSVNINNEYPVTYVDTDNITIPVDTTGASVTNNGHYIPSNAQLLYNTTTEKWEVRKEFEEIRLGELSGLDEDVLAQYLNKDGRSGGQTAIGGIGGGEDLVLESTSHATKGAVKTKDNFLPFAPANYSGGWAGIDLGAAGFEYRNIYSKGELIGARYENITSVPLPSGQSIGRSYFNTTDKQVYVDTGVAVGPIGAIVTKKTIVLAAAETTVVTVSDLVTDARNHKWFLQDISEDYEMVYCPIKATSATQVTIESSFPLTGNFVLTT